MFLASLLTTCAPIPDEGNSTNKARVTITLQHRADKAARSGTEGRKTEYIVVVPSDTQFAEQGPSNSLASGILDLPSNQITLDLELDTPLKLFIYRYESNLSLTDLQAKLSSRTLQTEAIDFGKTSEFTILSESTEESLSLTVLLQREAAFLDAAVQGIQVNTVDGTQTTDEDGLFVYFPEEVVELSLGDLSLGSFTNPVLLTPYTVFGVTEGESANNVLNLVRVLMTLDGDGNPDNGIQLSAAGVSQLGTLNLADFDTSPENFDQTLPQLSLVESAVANLHLKQLLQRKNNPPTVVSYLPLDNGSAAPLNTSIFVEFSEPLRQSTINAENAITVEAAGGSIAGTLTSQGSQLSFTPSSPLTANTTYTVTLDSALTDQDGKSISGTTQWSFLTGDLAAAPALLVKSTSPDNGSSEVPLNTTLAVYFAEPIFSKSEAELWVLAGDGEEIVCQSRISGNGVYCQPAQNLSSNINYTLTLQPNLVSSSGSELTEPFSFSFTTGSELLSTDTYLQHLGRLTDNYSNEATLSLLVSSASSQSLRYLLRDQVGEPTPEDAAWQTALSYPIEVNFTLSELSPGEKTIYAWFDDGEQIVDQTTLQLIYDPVSPTGSLQFAEPSTQNTEVGLTLSASDEHSLIGGYLIREDNLTPTLDTEGWAVLDTPSQTLELEIPYSVDPSNEGILTVYGWVMDLAGNPSDTFSDQLVVDYSPPMLSPNFTNPNYITDFAWGLFTLNLEIQDNAEGAIYYLFSLDDQAPLDDDQNWQIYAGDNLTFSLEGSQEGSLTFYLWLRDSAGNRSDPIQLESYLDRTPPSFEQELLINAGAISSGSPEVILSWKVSDNGSGLAAYYLSELEELPEDSAMWSAISATTDGVPYTFADTNEGLKTLYLFVKDQAQNVSVSHADIFLDFSSPQLQADSLPAYLNEGPHTISLSGEDFTGEVFYLFGETQAPSAASPEWIETVNGQATLSLADYSPGPVTLQLWIKDTAGNVALEALVLETIVELTPPQITGFQINAGATVTGSSLLQLSWNATDDLSGLEAFAIVEDGTSPLSTEWIAAQASGSSSYTLQDTSSGLKTLTLFVRDQAGNISQQQASITLDTDGPSVSGITLNAYINTTTPPPLTPTISDTSAGDSSYLLSTSNQAPDPATGWTIFSGQIPITFSGTGLQTQYLWLKDSLGNISGPITLQTTIDLTPPQVTNFLINSGDNYTNSSTLTLTWDNSTDDISGIASYFISDNSTAPTNNSAWLSLTAGAYSTSFTLNNLQQGSKTLYLYIRDQASNISSPVTDSITFDNQTPVGFLTLPHATNQASLPFLVMAFDNLSGAQRYQIQPAATPAPIDSDWTDFPNPPMNADNRSYFWDNVTTYNPEWGCLPIEELLGFVHGTFDPGTNANQEPHLPCDDPSIASFDNFSTLLPDWDNQTFTFANLDNSSPQIFRLWFQDQAGNTWESPEQLAIRFDNQSPDTSQATLLLDNGSLPPVDHYLNLHLFRNYQGDNDTELKLRFSTTDNDTRYVRAQLDNNTKPDPYDWYHWWPLDNNTFDNRTLWLPLDNSTQVQEQTLYIWLKDEAGNIDNLTPKNIYWAQLYSGEKRLDNESNPKADLNDNLSLKYSHSLSAQHPIDNNSLQIHDNATNWVNGNWTIDNDSLVFNLTSALTPEKGHRLDTASWNENDNITFYAAQTFKFNSDDVITIFIHDNATVESDDNITITFELSAPSTENFTVHLKTADNSTTGGVDYDNGSRTINVPAGIKFFSDNFTIYDDSIVENAESFWVVIDNITGSTLNFDFSDNATITIQDNDNATVSVDNASFSENSTYATVTFRLSDNVSENVTITYSTVNDSAAENDYNNVISKQLTFSPMQTILTDNISIISESIVEYNESFRIHIDNTSKPSSVFLPTTDGIITIENDDNASVSIHPISTSSIPEGDSGNSIFGFEIRLSDNVSDNVTVWLSTDNTTTQANDFEFFSRSIIFPAMTSVFYDNVTIYTDGISEDNETFKIQLDNVTHPSLSIGTDSLLNITILNDDEPGFSIDNSTLNVNESGSPNSFTVVLTSEPPSTDNVTFTISSSDISEVTVHPSTLTFDNTTWNTPQTVTVTGVDDNVSDGSIQTTITVAVDPDVSYSAFGNLDNKSVYVWNDDNDTAGFVLNNITNKTVSENGTTDSFSVVLTSQPTANVTLNVTDNYTSEVSYSPASLVFGSGNWSVSQLITLTGKDDNVSDENQTTLLTLVPTSADPKYDTPNLGNQTITITTTDNDSAGFVLNNITNKTVSEDGAIIDNFSVRLTSEPFQMVTLNFEDNGTSKVILPNNISFGSDNWSIPQIIQLFGIDDNVSDDNQTTLITFTADGSPEYVGRSDNFTVITTDNDTAGFSLSKTTAVVSENGTTDSFSVVLTSQPTANVTLTLSDNDTANQELGYSPSILLFGSGNWSIPQLITLTGIDDNVSDENQTTLLTLVPTSADPKYDTPNLGNQTITITTTDNDSAGFVLNNITNKTVSEDGAIIDNFSVRLTSEPFQMVTLNFEDNGTSKVILPNNISFGADNWSIPQIIQLFGIDDNVSDDNQTTLITFTADGSPEYVGRSDNFTVITTDNDTAGFSLSKTTAVVSENGTSDSFSVVLTSEPTANVTLTLSDNDTANQELGYSPSILLFGSGNWSIPQLITLTGIDDNVSDENQTTLLTLVPTSADPKYDTPNLGNQTITITTTDNDSAGFVLNNITNKTVSEDGAIIDNFSVRLTSEPFQMVTLNFEDNDTNEVILPNNISFGADNWSIPQIILLFGIDDNVSDDNQTTLITFTADGSPEYVGRSDNFTVITTDNDTAGFSLSKTTAVVSENGTSDSFSVVLTSEPTANVTLTLSDNDTANQELGYSPSILLFGSGNWSIPQWISLTSVDDNITQDNQSTLLTIVPTSDDANYATPNMDNQTVTVITTDNDTAMVTIADLIIAEGENGTIVLTLNNAVQGGFSVDVRTENGTAESAIDYTSLIQTVNFEGIAGESENLTISTLPDSNSEGNEEFWLVMENLSRALPIDISDNASIKITESAAVTIDNYTISESEYSITVDLKLDNPVPGGFKVDVSTVDGTATSVAPDYTAITNQLVEFSGNAGETKSVNISIYPDTLVELEEAFSIVMTNVRDLSGVSISTVNIDDNATIKISDDDKAYVYLSSPYVDAYESNNTPMLIPIKLSKPVPFDFIVNLKFDNYTSLPYAAAAGQDYNLIDNFTFPKNITSTDIEVEIYNDNVVEPWQYFYVEIVDTNSASVLFDPDIYPSYKTMGGIGSEDLAQFEISKTSALVSEDQSIIDNFTVKLLSQPESGSNVTFNSYVNFDNSSPSLVFEGDEIEKTLSHDLITSGPITFNSSNYNIPQTVTINGINDGYDDDNTTSTLEIVVDNTSSNSAWWGLSDSISVVSTDNGLIFQKSTKDPSKGITITQTEQQTQIVEGGASDNITIALDGIPSISGDQKIRVTLTPDWSQLTVNPAELEFTINDYNEIKSVSITAVADNLSEGPHTSDIIISIGSAYEQGFSTIPVSYLRVKISE